MQPPQYFVILVAYWLLISHSFAKVQWSSLAGTLWPWIRVTTAPWTGSTRIHPTPASTDIFQRWMGKVRAKLSTSIVLLWLKHGHIIHSILSSLALAYDPVVSQQWVELTRIRSLHDLLTIHAKAVKAPLAMIILRATTVDVTNLLFNDSVMSVLDVAQSHIWNFSPASPSFGRGWTLIRSLLQRESGTSTLLIFILVSRYCVLDAWLLIWSIHDHQHLVEQYLVLPVLLYTFELFSFEHFSGFYRLLASTFKCFSNLISKFKFKYSKFKCA